MTQDAPGAPLFHFSGDPHIRVFAPRPVCVGIDRGPARAWLNGPLVWAVDAPHSLLYLFPRDCPRIVIWPTAETTADDREAWFGDVSARAVAYVEAAWADRIAAGILQRYRMPSETFAPAGDPGAWVSRMPIIPHGRDAIRDLPGALVAAGVDLRILPRLTPLAGVWRSTLHASGIRLRNAQDWVTPEGGPPGPIAGDGRGSEMTGFVTVRSRLPGQGERTSD